MKCSYPKCNKKAKVTLGMADPDSEKIPYCKECAEKVRKITVWKQIPKICDKCGQEIRE